MIRPQPFLLHVGHCQPAGVKGAREIDGDDRVPFVDRKFLDRIDVLNAGVVHQDIDAAEFGPGLIDHLLDLVGIGNIGARIHHADIVLPLEIADDFVDLVGRAEAVEHDIGAGPGKPGGDTEPNTAGRAGDDGGFACRHFIPPQATQKSKRLPKRRM